MDGFTCSSLFYSVESLRFVPKICVWVQFKMFFLCIFALLDWVLDMLNYLSTIDVISLLKVE